MIIETKNFGSVNVDEENIYTFDYGIPAFEDLKKFTIIHPQENPEDKPLFSWLQSIEDPDTSFIIMEVYDIMPDYNPLVYDDDLASLGEVKEDNLLIYNIVVIPQTVSKMSVNLKAPVVINLTTKKGKQMVVKNEDYPVKYYFYEELKKKSGGE